MKGLAYRKLSRDSAHRKALLRNLATSLFHNERISTTVAKAKEAQRYAEKIITQAKRTLIEDKGKRQLQKAEGRIFTPLTTMPILHDLAKRYADRPGGYTRLFLHGHRPGDHAPRALLELVDQPKGDLKTHVTAMAIGRETYIRAQKSGGDAAIQREATSLGSQPFELDERYNEITRRNAAKVVKHGGDAARKQLTDLARDHFYRLMAQRQLLGDRRVDEEAWKKLGHNAPRGRTDHAPKPQIGQRRLAGMRKDFLQSGPDEPALRPRRGELHPNSVIRISKGIFAKRRIDRTLYPPPAPSASRASTRPVEAKN